MINLQHLITRTRTYRRFHEEEPIETTMLHELLELARLAGSARNSQPWQYSLINEHKQCEKVFPYLGWAGYLSDWKGPVVGERPGAYILCFLNTHWLNGSREEAFFDLGIASQNLLLAAMQKGIGGCRIGSISPKLATSLTLPDHLRLELIIALGKPKESVIVEDCQTEEDIRYWRDEKNVHHVPKRGLKDILISVSL